VGSADRNNRADHSELFAQHFDSGMSHQAKNSETVIGESSASRSIASYLGTTSNTVYAAGWAEENNAKGRERPRFSLLPTFRTTRVVLVVPALSQGTDANAVNPLLSGENCMMLA
jgi:hypothetical protein